jgi:hypothetical protein
MQISIRLCASISSILVFIILLSASTLSLSAQVEKVSPLTSNRTTNDTISAGAKNNSQPISFKVSSSSSEGVPGGDTSPPINQSIFNAQITWTPNDIGKENTFNIKFINTSSGSELQDIKYDIMIFEDGNHLAETHRVDQLNNTQKYVFPEEGFYSLKIDNIGNTTASIDLPMHVVPEFGNATLTTTSLMAGMLCIILIGTKLRAWKTRFFIRNCNGGL